MEIENVLIEHTIVSTRIPNTVYLYKKLFSDSE